MRVEGLGEKGIPVSDNKLVRIIVINCTRIFYTKIKCKTTVGIEFVCCM